MLRIRSKTSVRLITGFLFIIMMIVATAAVTFIYNARMIDETVAKITRRGETINRALLTAFYIREKHEYQAHLIMSRDPEYVEKFKKAVIRTEKWLQRLGSELQGDEERGFLGGLIESNRTFDRLFFEEMVPAVEAADGTRIMEIHGRSEMARSRIKLWTDRLTDYLRERIDLAVMRASEVRAKAITATVIAVGLITVMAVFMGLKISLSIVRPIQALMRGTEYVSKGDFSRRIDLQRSDEFGKLADSFNRMTAKLREHQEKLVQSEKMASLGQLAAGVAHEINNPLGVILGYLKILLKDRDERDRDYEDLKIIEEEAQQCKNIVEDLLALSRPVDLTREAVDLREVIEEEVERVSSRQRGNRLEIIKEIGPTPLILFTERKKMKQVISNLLANSVEAMAGGGKITLRAYLNPQPTIETMDDDSGSDVEKFLVMEVSDTGCGIPSGSLRRIFDPFFTTKEDGTGLGLSIIYGIIKAHRGVIDVRSTPGKGTTFIVNIPIAEEGRKYAEKQNPRDR